MKEPVDRKEPSFIGALATVSGLAVTYFIAGKLSRLLAIPPGYASPVWPPAGIALAAVLLFGYRVWPGILIGSFLVNAWTPFPAVPFPAMAGSLALPAAIAAGSAAQAVLGAFLIRRIAGFPLSLNQMTDVFKMLALGAASCALNATIGAVGLLASGSIQWNALTANWGTWWAGDAVGVLVVLPMAATWRMELARSRPGIRAVVLLPVLLTALLTVLLFLGARSGEWERTQSEFERRTNFLVQKVRSGIDDHIDDLHQIDSLFQASREVEREEFHRFVEKMCLRHPGLRAIEWIPRVPAARRAMYEAAARREGYRGFRFIEENAHQQIVPASRRPEHFPVYYLEPYVGNEPAFGFDMASAPARMDALQRARDTGLPTATSRIPLVQEKREHPGVIIVLPVYGRGSPLESVEQRRKSLRGFAAGVIVIGDMVDAALAPFDRTGVRVRILDGTAREGERLLYDSDPAVRTGAEPSMEARMAEEPHELRSIVPLPVAGRTWTIRFSATSEYPAAPIVSNAWTVLTGGLLFSSLLGVFLMLVAGRVAVTERMVADRTAELAASNVYLEEAMKKAQEADHTKSAFLASMSHELRTPLNSIIGFSRILLNEMPGPLNPEQKKQMGMVFGSAKHLLDLINDVLDIAKIEAGEISLSRETFRFRDLVDQTREALSPMAANKGLTLSAEIASDVDEVVGDRRRVQQVLINLVNNAVKFTERGRVTISCRVLGDRLETRVTDTGIGIREEDMGKIFEAFRQVDSGLARKYEGTGLGLAITRHLLERMGGGIRVESRYGEGSTFIVEIPLRMEGDHAA